eukprot:gene9263-1044_t
MTVMKGIVFCVLVLLPASALGCTTVIVGKDATIDGSVMATHSDDGGAGPDSRLLLTPAFVH